MGRERGEGVRKVLIGREEEENTEVHTQNINWF